MRLIGLVSMNVVSASALDPAAERLLNERREGGCRLSHPPWRNHSAQPPSLTVTEGAAARQQATPHACKARKPLSRRGNLP
jgi:hypothetical protein